MSTGKVLLTIDVDPRASQSETSPEVEREKERFKNEKDPKCATAPGGVEKLDGPAQLSQSRPDGREQNQVMPAFAQRDRCHPEVEQSDVEKERRRVVRAAREQRRRKETA